MTPKIVDALRAIVARNEELNIAEETSDCFDFDFAFITAKEALAEYDAPVVDTAYIAIGRWKGVEQIWRGGVFESAEEAEAEFEASVDFGTFVCAQAVELR